MKRNLINTAVGALAAALLCGAGAAWAQTPAQIHMQQQQQNQNMGGMIQSDNVRNCGNPNGCSRNSGSSAAKYREPTFDEIRRAGPPLSLRQHRADIVDGCILYLSNSDIGLSRGQVSNLCNCTYEGLANKYPSPQSFLNTLERKRLGQMRGSEYQEFNRLMEEAANACARR